jgi:hypothetical protein
LFTIGKENYIFDKYTYGAFPISGEIAQILNKVAISRTEISHDTFLLEATKKQIRINL